MAETGHARNVEHFQQLVDIFLYRLRRGLNINRND
jgi:hypothetical protein